MQPFDLVFLDPPYGKGLRRTGACNPPLTGGWISDGAIAVLEERADVVIELPADFEEIDARVYGDTKIIVMLAFQARTSASTCGSRPGDMLE